MSLVGRIFRSSENVFSKNWSVICANNWNEFASLPKKIEVPLPPKKPMTAYMLFVKENRQNLLKENPDLKVTEQIKRLAQKWNELPLESKKPFEVKAREKTLLYGEEHKQYYESLSDQQKEEIARQKAQKKKARQLYKLRRALQNSNVPRPPASAYTLFVQSFSRDKSGIREPKDFLKEVAEKWKSLSEKDKKALEKQAEDDKARYKTEMMEWQERMVKEGNEKLVKAFDALPHKGKSLIEDFLEEKPKKSKTEKVKGAKSKPKVSACKK